MAAKGVAISGISAGSIGEELGICPGDRLVAINGRAVKDILDYQYLSADDNLDVEIIKSNGEQWSAEIEKNYSEILGLEFDQAVFDRIRPCINKCIFCFVDQLPSGMRESLYVKDDDYRLSFLFGNFITLTNLTKQDWDKLMEMRLSPLYVSVHATDPDVRELMLGTVRARNIMEQLSQLKQKDIEIHTQIVLCPGVNDGGYLTETVENLASLWPSVRSVGIVPVGLTGYREGLPLLSTVSEKLAREIIQQVDQWQNEFRDKWHTGFVYLADEFYIKAGQDFPPDEYYDEYPQLENGIGLARSFLEEFAVELEHLKNPTHEGEISNLVCGYSAMPVMTRVIESLKMSGYQVNLIPITNEYFSGGVTVTGLLTGSDIKKTLAWDYVGQQVLIPKVMLRDGQSAFLDDVTIDELSLTTGALLMVVDPTPKALMKCLTGQNSLDRKRKRLKLKRSNSGV